jgi:hypothetical protein
MPGYAAIAAEKSVTISSFVHIAESAYDWVNLLIR